MSAVLGWDIGGVNTKVVRVARGEVVDVRARAFEIQRRPQALRSLLVELAGAARVEAGEAHAVTMTAELSQAFRTKREGVRFVLDHVIAAFPGALVRAYTVDGRFVDAAAARDAPLEVAASNWTATARVVAQSWPDAVLIDVGSTTTDVTPIVAGAVAARGRTDPERLQGGELVYTGALRTPAEAITPAVPFRGEPTGTAAEGFAIAGDAHLWRRQLVPSDYSVPTPDGRPATREFAGERLARVVCADREMLDEAAISAIADALWEAQVDRIASAVARIVRRHPSLEQGRAVVTGLGDFLAAEAAGRAGLQVTRLAERWGRAARHAPAAAVALLLAVSLEKEIIER
jgi:(4-(4-[2-(gamma-L-glutamylamino)ethyl]phenoxymethyl)furan-2-yl)methanamine synthase